MSFYVYETQHEKGEENIMGEKIKLTQSQIDMIDRIKSNVGKELMIRKRATGEWYTEKNQFLNKLTLEELSRILYEPKSYEVEPEYKVGDWVVKTGFSYMDGLIIGQLYKNAVGELDVDRAERMGLAFGSADWRHATPEEIKAEKERRLWKSIGREVGGFKVGDLGITHHHRIFVQNETDITRVKHHYRAGILKGFYPAESFISFEGVEGE